MKTMKQVSTSKVIFISKEKGILEFEIMETFREKNIHATLGAMKDYNSIHWIFNILY